ncbi:LytTR family DNA-binding domain-containing protein [Tamlana sp. 2_MG-2023]|uniref:LytTR family DNA-binding domain-containing protein n=1 Tax=unclassified Tamlana TaxID=2614803 RepID=UPI0026E332EE|nr:MULTISPECIES: LytTR family DNA-binding domain-containing protein [unclassified Tamlana]MDO6759655.1 LytTR family DNA-binding domain-containing protein [Tamlana sp. 2_MG-2023]MDO6791278.1 LytTR family DNA-binding domain-containing protein [Tamlana sp. 1_MG-2023]
MVFKTLNIHLKNTACYLDSNSFKWFYICCSIGFTVLFLLIFQPFGISDELNNHSKSYLDFAALLLGVSIAVFCGLYLSQFILRSFFKIYEKPLKVYLFWFVIEAIILVALYFVVSLFIPDLGQASRAEEWTLQFQLKNVLQALAILIFPFSMSLLLMIYKHQKSLINQMETKVQLASKPMFENPEIIAIKNEKNAVALKINLNDLVFIKSDNQYVEINYFNSGKLETQLVRARLKSILDAYPDKGLVRTHRSFIVNTRFIKDLEKIGPKYQQQLTVEGLSTPVSNSYLTSIEPYTP